MAGATAEALVADTDGAMEAVVAAPINYGYRSQQRSGGGFHLSGTTSLSGTCLLYTSSPRRSVPKGRTPILPAHAATPDRPLSAL